MTYFADLSPYEYAAEAGDNGLRCVGWLDAKHAFARGAVPPEFVEALAFLCASQGEAVTRGFHHCEFAPCDTNPYWPPLSLTVNGIESYLGSAEIRVKGEGGIWFAAPNLVYHYVEVHRYRPPDVFIAAVLNASAG